MSGFKARNWRGTLRAFVVGVIAAGIAVAAMSLLGVYDDLVIIVAALTAVLLETFIHRRWLRRPRQGTGDN